VIIVALIAIATMGVITLFGDNIRRLFGASADALGGDTDLANPNTFQADAALTEKNMTNFAAQSSAYDPSGIRTGGGGPGSFSSNSAN
jgi:hypothetical protein